MPQLLLVAWLFVGVLLRCSGFLLVTSKKSIRTGDVYDNIWCRPPIPVIYNVSQIISNVSNCSLVSFNETSMNQIVFKQAIATELLIDYNSISVDGTTCYCQSINSNCSSLELIEPALTPTAINTSNRRSNALYLSSFLAMETSSSQRGCCNHAQNLIVNYSIAILDLRKINITNKTDGLSLLASSLNKSVSSGSFQTTLHRLAMQESEC